MVAKTNDAATRGDGPTPEPSPRDRLLLAAFEEIYAHGYQGTRVDRVLEKTGLTKGAFYYYFPSKQALAYAVVDEIIAGIAEEMWRQTLEDAADPIEAIGTVLERISVERGEGFCTLGCPINNLAQEMSSLDDGFRTRLHGIFAKLIGWIADALARGKEAGTVRAEIDTHAVATFVVAAFEGCIGLAKNEQSTATLELCATQIGAYLDTMRAR